MKKKVDFATLRSGENKSWKLPGTSGKAFQGKGSGRVVERGGFDWAREAFRSS